MSECAVGSGGIRMELDGAVNIHPAHFQCSFFIVEMKHQLSPSPLCYSLSSPLSECKAKCETLALSQIESC